MSWSSNHRAQQRKEDWKWKWQLRCDVLVFVSLFRNGFGIFAVIDGGEVEGKEEGLGERRREEEEVVHLICLFAQGNVKV